MRTAIVALALVVGCSQPELREVACTNGVDDDADGLFDCADPDCVDLSDVCETTLESCRDGRDSDLDGATDCEDARCVDAGHCATFTVDGCQIRTGEGCPIGMSCYSNVGYTVYACARPPQDARQPREVCDPSIATTGGCGAGSFCRGTFCAAACRDDRDCPMDSLCAGPDGIGNRFCHHQCSLALDNCGVSGTSCVSLQLLGLDTDDPRNALGICVTGAIEAGEGSLGEPCDDDRPCSERLICMADADGDKACRRPCEWSPTDRGVCSAGELCTPLHPTHPNVSAQSGTLQGVCLPEGA